MSNKILSDRFSVRLIQANLIEGVIQADRLDQLTELYYLLETQLPMVTHAYEELRQFIEERFSLADLLHVSVDRSSRF